MGADQSKLGDASTVRHAFNVLRVDEHSPAAQAKLHPYFDYIVSVNGVEILQEIPNVVSEMAKNHIDRPMKMTVYNSRVDSQREVTIVPNRAWGGKTLLGASIRFCQVNDAADRVWHVVDVTLNSPAHTAGLIPLKDWIIGSPDIAINTSDDFYNLMIHNQKRPVRLLVFNLDKETVREVTVTPDFDWGGQGCLGCDVASGALHRIPPPTTTPNGQPLPSKVPLATGPHPIKEREAFEETQLAPASTLDQAPSVTTQTNATSSLSHADQEYRVDPVPGVPGHAVVSSVQEPVSVSTFSAMAFPSSSMASSEEIPKPAIPIAKKVQTNLGSPSTLRVTMKIPPNQANLQPIPGFGEPSETSNNGDLSFLQ